MARESADCAKIAHLRPLAFCGPNQVPAIEALLKRLRHAARPLLALLWAFAGATALPVAATPSHWVLIDTDTQTLLVLREQTVVDRFKQVAIGYGGPSRTHYLGDATTPRGDFIVKWINESSRFRLFFGLDYPRPEHALEAFQNGRIDEATYDEIRWSARLGRLPPQDTPLGGNIGIHGLGAADPEIHRDFNWTDGCVALTNAQIDRLRRYVSLGTRVLVR